MICSDTVSLENKLHFHLLTFAYAVAVTHAHSSFGFAGVFLLKMTRLFHPDSAELAYAVSLVERLAEVLSRSAFVSHLLLCLN